jgi:hypothetical protein
MFALAVAVSAFGYYQVLVSLPADRAAYAADPERVKQTKQTFRSDWPLLSPA